MALPTRSASAASAIPTTYRGTQFRSRLEARWASFFDLVEWPWVYEPFDTGDWIPDFLVRGAAPFLVEVGACEYASDYSSKAEKPLAAFPPVPAYCERVDHESCYHGKDFVLETVPERTTLILGILPTVATFYGEAAGIITDDGGGAGPDSAIWGRCATCDGICVTHATGVYRHWPCGHWHDNTCTSATLDAWILETWNRASSPVQWRGPARRRAR